MYQIKFIRNKVLLPSFLKKKIICTESVTFSRLRMYYNPLIDRKK